MLCRLSNQYALMGRSTVVVACLLVMQSSQAALNVKHFGAKGDGVTDDTAAIRATVEAAQKAYTLGTHQQVDSQKDPTGGWQIPTRPEIVFPSGRYLVSDEIYVAGGVIRGEGEALITQSDADKDIFTSQTAWRMTISGLTFAGGRNQLQLSNPNTDSGFVLIEQCRFYGAAGVAIIMDKGSNSTQLKIRDCVFIQPEQALVSYTDETNMTDCWITSKPDMENKAVIENRGGRMVLEKILGVPLVKGNSQRWIDHHYGWLTCREFRFGGEGGGFTPVVNFAKFYSTSASDGIGPSILVENCDVSVLRDNRRPAAVYCEEIPNGIVIRDCRINSPVPALMVNPKIDLTSYFGDVERSMLGFRVEGNRGLRSNEWPSALRDLAIRPARHRSIVNVAQ